MIKKLLILSLLLFLSITNVSAAGEVTIDGPSIIYKQADVVLTTEDILPLYTGSNLVLTKDEFTGMGDIPGSYEMTLSDGINSFDFIINVKQILGQIKAVSLMGDKYTIHVSKTMNLSLNDIATVLSRVGAVTLKSSTVREFPTNTYTENKTSPGLYVVEMKLSDPDGTIQRLTVDIKVDNSTKLTLEVEETSSFSFKTIMWTLLALIIAVLILYNFILPFLRNAKRQRYGRM